MFYPNHTTYISGNLKYLLEYVLQNDPTVNVKIVSNNKRIEDSKYQSFITSKLSLKGLWTLLRANFIITDAGTPYNYGRFSVIQLWHGTGYKNILALSGKYSLKENKKRLKNISFIPATSQADKERKKKSFLTEKVYITGSPRNDVFFERDKNLFFIKEKLCIPKEKKIICYAPTFRDQSDFNPFSDKFYEKAERWLEENETFFLIKKHPSDVKFNPPKNFPNIVDISKVELDVQSILMISDILISDYSGISSDFLLLDRPIIFYTYDFETYLRNDRDFYFDLKSILPGPFANNENELLELLKDISWFENYKYQKEYKDYQKMFHKYIDGNSCKRVYEKMINLNGK